MAATAKKVTVKALAERLKVDARDLRKWLRAQDMGVGRGGKRYEFTAQQATKIAQQFQADAEKDKDEAKEEKAA